MDAQLIAFVHVYNRNMSGKDFRLGTALLMPQPVVRLSLRYAHESIWALKFKQYDKSWRSHQSLRALE